MSLAVDGCCGVLAHATDANATIEVLDLQRAVGPQWAQINLNRDYVLFDLLSGARSDDPGNALIPPRSVDGANAWTGATWLWAAELDEVCKAIRSVKVILRRSSKRSLQRCTD